jgi:hypothetical protein
MSTHRSVIIEPAIKPVESALSEPIPQTVERSAPIDIKFPVINGNVFIPMYNKELITPINPDVDYVLHFSDFSSIRINRSVKEEYPDIDVISKERTRAKFEKYILKILNNDKLVLDENLDTLEELGEIINEIKKYKLFLDDRQLMNIHTSSGLIELINKCKYKYNKKMNNCLNSMFKKKLSIYSDLWDTLVNNMKKVNNNDKLYDQVKFDIIMNVFEASNYEYNLCILNLGHDNMISLFFKFWKFYLIEDHDHEIRTLIKNLSASIAPALETLEQQMFKYIDIATGGTPFVSTAVKGMMDVAKIIMESKNNVLKN